jgi:iron complex transport system substrate-binding protein
VNSAGTNDYWARGVARPDIILADLIKIFHPDLAKDHEFEWYLQVPKNTP